jgi:hypothetical protein
MIIIRPATGTIFPHTSFDVDKMIIDSCDDDRSLVNFSGVNRKAYHVLSNDFFRRRFEALYPFFIGKNACPTLQVCHPDNCWKVICCICSDRGRWSECPKFKLSFKKEGSQIYLSFLNSKKLKKESELATICGSYYQDPTSPIDQAWKAFAKEQKEVKNLRDVLQPQEGELEKLLQSLRLDSDVEGKRIRIWLENYGNELFASYSDEEISHLTDVELEEIDRNLIPKYRLLATQIMPLCKAFQEKSSKESAAGNKYRTLESKRAVLEKRIRALDSSISDVDCAYSSALWIDVLKIKAGLIQEVCVPILTECKALIKTLQVQGDLVPDPMRHPICHLINSLPETEKVWIWQTLYDKCANKVIEDQWSEKHWHEFLLQLYLIVEDSLQRIGRFHQSIIV